MSTKRNSKVKSKRAAHRRAAESRAVEAATGKGRTPSKTAEVSKRRAQPTARPRNANLQDDIEPGASKNTRGKAANDLESSNPAKRPSRKSTRGGANHAKPDSQLQRRAKRAIRSPSARAVSRGG